MNVFGQIDLAFVPDKANNILYFVLIWNIFEGVVFNYRANISAFEKFVTELENNNKIEFSNYDVELAYFKARFMTNGKTNEKFDRLNFCLVDKKELVANAPEGPNRKAREIVLALLIIVFRLSIFLFMG